MRIYADWAGVAPIDCEAARFEAEMLQQFQAASDDPRIDGGFYFGRNGTALLPYVSPVSSAFAIQALELWRARASGAPQVQRRLLI